MERESGWTNIIVLYVSEVESFARSGCTLGLLSGFGGCYFLGWTNSWGVEWGLVGGSACRECDIGI